MEFFRNIKRIISWIPFLWEDRDWDYQYVWSMQREKLRRLRVCIKENDFIADADKVCAEIKVAETILSRLLDDEYLKKDWDELHKTRILYKDFEERINNQTPEYYDKLSDLFDREEVLRVQDMAYLGEYLRKHIRTWWD